MNTRLLKQYFFTAFLFLLGVLNAQQYPVNVAPVLLPPYSLKLGDYATTGDNRLQLQILMNDLMEPSHQVRLHFTLEAGTNSSVVAQSTDYVVGMKNITLSPGVPLVLSNIDVRPLFQLQNLNGISASQYARPLSSGVYRFCFQVQDAFTKRSLSQKSCAMAYLVQYDPPMLSLPQNGELIMKKTEIQNHVFQWMARHQAPNTRYIFTLKEIWDRQRDPVTAFLTSPALWTEEVYGNSLFYGMAKPQLLPGKRYAWQVQAKSGNPVFDGNPTEDNGVYKNNGLSEIFYFDFVENCNIPMFLSAKNVGRGKAEIRWSYPHEKPNGMYKVQYRKRKSSANWMEVESYEESAFLSGLKNKTEYEYRVGAICGMAAAASVYGGDSNLYSYSNIQYFTTDSKDEEGAYQCGVLPQVEIKNKKPLQEALVANEVFTAGDFPITIISAEGSNGNYTGEGYIVVPYLGNTKLKVSFTNIKLNTERQLISGIVETTYDPSESAVHSASNAWSGFGDKGIKEINFDYPIDKIEYVSTPPPGTINVIGKDSSGQGQGASQTYPAGKDTQIVDSEGNIWQVDKDGNVTEGGKAAEGGTSTSSNTDGVASIGNSTKVENYTAKGLELVWEELKDKTTYTFDTPENSGLPISDYPNVKNSKGETIAVPYKLVVNGKTDFLQANVAITDEALKDAKIIFKTLKGGKEIKAQENKVSATQRLYELELKGAYNYAEEEIIAVAMPIDSIQKQQIISSFNLVHVKSEKPKVHLVPLDNASVQKLKTIEDNIKTVYNKVGANFEIVKENVLDITGLAVGNTIESGDPKLMSTYGSDQIKINNHYLNTRSKELRYVVFVTEKSSSTVQAGYMRLNGQFGYVFNNSSIKTAAHELGHGIFKLEHPTTNSDKLLMSNGTGEFLSHQDWKQIGDPKFKLYTFQTQSEGEYETDGHYSTVYLVSLMLGMDNKKAKELAIATEAPDTTVHSETKFELNDTWGHIDGSQQNIHSLTGGFHGIEEFFTAIKFLYAPKDNIKFQGEMLHRFGDTYAHTKIGNLKPNDIKENLNLESADNSTIQKIINSWSQIGSEKTLGSSVEPWVKFFNYYIGKYGLDFLRYEHMQKEIFKGKTLKQTLKDIYLKNKSADYIMYGEDGFTLDHAKSDGSYPDFIYLRPNWYYIYVQNLSWLISTKYGLDNSKLDLTVFDKMISFVNKNQCTMKGIIDYEVAKKLGKNEFYIPIFYASGNRLLASIDANFNTNYLKVAKEVVENTKKYLIEQGISESNIKVEEVKELQPNGRDAIEVVVAYKVTIK